MTKRLSNKIEKYIRNELQQIEKYTIYDDYDSSLYDFIDYGEVQNGVQNTDAINLLSFELSVLEPFQDEKIYDIKFLVEHKDNQYTFETSNYYHCEDGTEVEDIYGNINRLLGNFEFLLENYDYFIKYPSDDDEYEDEDTIDDVAHGCGYEIDDDGHWIELEYDYLDHDPYDSFKYSLECSGYKWIFDDTEETGRFYWED